MNITEANTEPFYQFHRFNEELNRNMRIIVAGLATVNQIATQNRTAGGPIQLPTDGEPWGKIVWNSPSRMVPPARRFVSQMGVVRVITALEDFCVGVKAEYHRCAEIHGTPIESNHASEIDGDGISPMKLYDELAWNRAVLDSLSPLYEYFSKVRNCIVHRSGRASQELIKNAGSSRLAHCVNGWQGPRKKTLPPLPAIVVGSDLPLLPRHAILASEICRRIAVDANEKLLRYLGVEGLAYMAAHHSQLSNTPIPTNARATAQGTLNAILTNRYRVKLDYREEAVQALGRLGRWKAYLRRFERLHEKQASS